MSVISFPSGSTTTISIAAGRTGKDQPHHRIHIRNMDMIYLGLFKPKEMHILKWVVYQYKKRIGELDSGEICAERKQLAAGYSLLTLLFLLFLLAFQLVCFGSAGPWSHDKINARAAQCCFYCYSFPETCGTPPVSTSALL